jgi:hypothetical protein
MRTDTEVVAQLHTDLLASSAPDFSIEWDGYGDSPQHCATIDGSITPSVQELVYRASVDISGYWYDNEGGVLRVIWKNSKLTFRVFYNVTEEVEQTSVTYPPTKRKKKT